MSADGAFIHWPNARWAWRWGMYSKHYRQETASEPVQIQGAELGPTMPTTTAVGAKLARDSASPTTINAAGAPQTHSSTGPNNACQLPAIPVGAGSPTIAPAQPTSLLKTTHHLSTSAAARSGEVDMLIRPRQHQPQSRPILWCWLSPALRSGLLVSETQKSPKPTPCRSERAREKPKATPTPAECPSPRNQTHPYKRHA
jgi:hypothetical protein